MSARLLKKVLQEREPYLPSAAAVADEGVGEDEAESPLSAAPSKNPFDLLGFQEDEQNAPDEDEEADATEEKQHAVKKSSSVLVPTSISKQKKKKRKKKNKGELSEEEKAEKSVDKILEDLSIEPRSSDGLEEIKVMANNGVQVHSKKHTSSAILAVDPKHLKAENELKRIFGSKVVSSFENSHNAGSSRQMYGGRRVAHNPRRTILVTPSSYWPRWDGSMTMELLESKDGLQFFRYVHPPNYRHVQEAFEAAKAANDINAIVSILARYPYHVESLLTLAEVFKFSGEHQSSADAIGKCLYALECAWHPLFSPLQGNCQLQFLHDTNKPLFSAIFSHMKIMDRRGCHRSALEVCKFLLSVDADDPKGVLFCIDYYSLRAQEYEWLEQFAEAYKSDNSLWLFPNFSYSLAISRFYLERDGSASTSKTEKSPSIDLMKQALMLHPLVLQKIVDKAPLTDPAWKNILKKPFFGAAKAGSPSLEHLINIYVERNYIIWRYPELQNFLKEAALMVVEALKEKSSEAEDWACVRKEAFTSDKNEYSHLLVSDFSDAIPTIPPEEVWHLMGGPQMMPHGNGNAAAPDRAHAPAPQEVAGRNPAMVFLESLLPWFALEDSGNDLQDGHPRED